MKFTPVPLMVLLLAILTPAIVEADELDDMIAPLLRDITELEEKHVDVSNLVGKLDEAVRLWSSGDRDEALRLIEDVRVEIEKLKGEAWRYDLAYKARVALTSIILLLTPLAFYTLFPRIYLMLWFRFRRNWIVVRRSAPRR